MPLSKAWNDRLNQTLISEAHALAAAAAGRERAIPRSAVQDVQILVAVQQKIH